MPPSSTLTLRQWAQVILLSMLCAYPFSVHARHFTHFVQHLFKHTPSPLIKAEHIPTIDSIPADQLTRGPSTLSIADHATLNLPEGYGFIAKENAQALLNATGNQAREELEGIIFP